MHGSVEEGQAGGTAPARAFVASTVVAVPVDPEAARLVKAAFEGARLDYGPSTIGDLQENGAAKCDACSEIIGASNVGGVRCDAAAGHCCQF